METELKLNHIEQSLVDALEDSSEISVLSLIEPVTAQKVLKAIYIKQHKEMPLFAAVGESLIAAFAKQTNDDELGAVLRTEAQHATSY